jgi:hypothetical protein
VSGRATVRIAAATVCSLIAMATQMNAVVCAVPADRPTVQAAVSDPGCTEVQVAAGTYDERVVVSREVEISGAGPDVTRLSRPLHAVGAETVVTVGGFAIDVGGQCYPELLTVGGGAALAVDPTSEVPIRVRQRTVDPCRLFDDGFESATLHAWSAKSP